MEDKKITIEYLGEKLSPKYYLEIPDDIWKSIKEEYLIKPDFSKVIKEIKSLSLGKTTLSSNINKYYYFDLMTRVKLYTAKWSVYEALQSKEVMSVFWGRMNNQNVWKKSLEEGNSPGKVFGRAIQLGGKGLAMIPSNFPLKEMLRILEKYNVNNNYYDYSCGWGVRLLGAMIKNINYYGTDPNTELYKRLLQFTNDYREHKQKTLFEIENKVDIRCQGSEHFIPELENKIGLAFSSPPYFDLEDYRIGENQSIKVNPTYQGWLDNYLEPTIHNIYKYLIKGGYFLINIKDYSKYDLVNQSKNIALKYGFKQCPSERLKNIVRIGNGNEEIDNSEEILVFQKI